MNNLLPADGMAVLFPALFTPEESDGYFQLLKENINWKQEPVILFGKTVMQPRLTAWYGDEGKTYSYSGITMQPLRWTEELLAIKSKVEAAAGQDFNSALLNFYRNGQDSMGWHRDNESSLGINPVIGSVSFGAERVFQFRHYMNRSVKRAVLLTHGSLLIMGGETQHYWQHALPKTARPIGARINITFRKIK
ncbi:alpha-ketoglutarate-dependent dioxygenase AlkB family protein [Chitinophaga sp. GCM10012297]|uniref:Alpha-ketoglutarate-dependent dioxygenase AlkB n=1 Tax=Chitinophaga chungangae TaxID=2821488 RepID=A0ABS3YH52_9BACT|nr:alpha-ketoglutarate-dependent dioxygenase AlkB [Chitinophaga chungangae]MBO9154017.1 alpha-ketoglutarate-dependent dioxygenase AlkB [Chitinophaga chungangae]